MRIIMLGLTVCLLAGSAPAHGQEAPEAPVSNPAARRAAGETRGTFDAPTWVALRSLVVPGWGQVKNGAWWKAVLVAGIEGAMLERLYFEDRRVHVYREKRYDYPGQAEFYERKEERHKSHRRDFIWWTSLFVLFSMGDAFVDAHLQAFDVTLEGTPPPAEEAGREAQELSMRLGLGWRW